MNADNSPKPDEKIEESNSPLPTSSDETPVKSEAPFANISEVRNFLAQNILAGLSHDERDDYQEFFVEDYSDIGSASSSKLSTWESKNGMPNKLYFSLSEAAHIADLDPSALIHAGANGSAVLCTPLPQGLVAFPFYQGKVGNIVDQPELLTLSEDDCRSIELNGFVAKSEFENGYAFTFAEVTCIFPGYRNYDFMHKEATWKLFGGETPVYINITRHQLFITRLCLYQFLDGQAKVAELGNKPCKDKLPDTDPNPWLIKNDNDPEPEYDWYVSARYFARELIKEDKSLNNKLDLLAKKVIPLLTKHQIFKRGGKKPFAEGTVKKSFTNCNFLKNSQTFS